MKVKNIHMDDYIWVRRDKKKRPRIKLYALLRYNESGELEGYVEHSFSMAWSKEFVNIWGSPPEKEMPNVKFLASCGGWMGDKYAIRKDEGQFIVRIHSKKCPIEVDISNFKIEKDKKKFNYRNVPFTIKK